MSHWESEKQLADKLGRLRAQVEELQNEIRGDALASKTPRGPVLPTDDERRSRSMSSDAQPPEPSNDENTET